MTPNEFITLAILPGLSLLPAKMSSKNAIAMIVAIALQESGLEHRRQMNEGPAKGFTQFEQGGGIHGVLTHEATRDHIRWVLTELCYDDSEETSWNAIEHNDVLCAVYSRLNLWWLPHELPEDGDYEGSWNQYIEAWRPGKPHRDTWDQCYRDAWEAVDG